MKHASSFLCAFLSRRFWRGGGWNSLFFREDSWCVRTCTTEESLSINHDSRWSFAESLLARHHRPTKTRVRQNSPTAGRGGNYSIHGAPWIFVQDFPTIGCCVKENLLTNNEKSNLSEQNWHHLSIYFCDKTCHTFTAVYTDTLLTA